MAMILVAIMVILKEWPLLAIISLTDIAMYMANIGGFLKSCQNADQQWKWFIEMWLLLLRTRELCILKDFKIQRFLLGVQRWFLCLFNQGSMEIGADRKLIENPTFCIYANTSKIAIRRLWVQVCNEGDELMTELLMVAPWCTP